MNLYQLGRRKKQLTAAVYAWAANHSDKFVVVDTPEYIVHEEGGEHTIDGFTISLAASSRAKANEIDRYQVSMEYLGWYPEQWTERLDLKVRHMVKSLRNRTNRAGATSTPLNPKASTKEVD